MRAADELPDELVDAGFSLGVLPAQKLAQTRAGARGALLFYSCVPVSEFGSSWPAGVPVQIHGMDADPIFVGEGDVDAARALVESAEDAELFLYPGDQHYFAAAACRATTRRPPRCSRSACWRFSQPGADPGAHGPPPAARDGHGRVTAAVQLVRQ